MVGELTYKKSDYCDNQTWYYRQIFSPEFNYKFVPPTETLNDTS
ncbi:Uncharacterised protein [Fluoribacter dumoffii]|uniref:Uncharacterized protein n=1 Tax=Fluoribacter dumoffii TaxID=463 RepID=A0A377GEI2_9GAMM|nr:Uncharacterised protein [Fluoribacter dumoffii]